MNGAMMPTAEQYEVRQLRGAPVCPVANVMTLRVAGPAGGKAAALIAMLERAAQGRWDRPGPDADLGDPACRVVTHQHAARVAGQPLGRPRGDVLTVFQGGLTGLVGIGQDRRVHVE